MGVQTTIKAAIKAKLEAVSGIKAVYDYGKGEFTVYPTAVIVGAAVNIERESGQHDKREYQFVVRVYHELKSGLDDAGTIETKMNELGDTLLDAFEADYKLGGVCDDCFVDSIFGFEDREALMRVIELKVNCKILIQY